MTPSGVKLCEVAPRDGLQNEERVLEPAVRAELVRRLAAAGLPRIEVGSFVDPRRVPQMAGVEEVVAAVGEVDAQLAGLVLNERGFERAAACGLPHVTMAIAVTDAYNTRNQGATAEQSMQIAARIAERAHAGGMTFTLTLAVAFGCPFEGAVDEARVLALAERAVAAGADELALADTIGVGVPRQVRRMLPRVAAFGLPVGAHLHNTRNTGYANALAAAEAGAAWLDASVGGIGGCPFAPRATGNVATEDLAYLLRGEGIDTGVELDALIGVAEWLAVQLGRELPGELHRAGDFSPAGA